MKFLDAEATRAGLPFDRLVPALREMFREGCEVPARHVHKVQGPQGKGVSLIMPAWQGRWFGVKTVNIFADNHTRHLPGLFSTYILYDASTGQPVLMLDGDEITSRRTAAASALAATYLAPEGANTLLVVGCGRVGSLLPEAYLAALPITKVLLWNRRSELAETVAIELRAKGIDAQAMADLPAAAGMADIVCCATLGTAPVVRGEWLKPGGHLDLIGSFTPEMREADDACFSDCDLFVDTPEALQKSGELLGPMSRDVFHAEDVRGTLEQLTRGLVPGRRHAARRTVFKAVGSALEDLAAAALAARHAGH